MARQATRAAGLPEEVVGWEEHVKGRTERRPFQCIQAECKGAEAFWSAAENRSDKLVQPAAQHRSVNFLKT